MSDSGDLKIIQKEHLVLKTNKIHYQKIHLKILDFYLFHGFQVRVCVNVDSSDLIWVFTGDSDRYDMSPWTGVDGGVGEIHRTVPPGVLILQLTDVLKTVQGQTHSDLSWKYVNSYNHIF